MADLSITYMGLKLKNPVIAGSSNLAMKIENVKAMEEAGVGAIVYKSLFEEQVNFESADFDESMAAYNDRHAESTRMYPEMQHAGPKEFLMQLKKIKEVATVPIIASINALYTETWVEYAKLIEKTGVDALEINLFKAPKKFQESAQESEEFKLKIIKSVKKAVKIPVAVKLSPFYSSMLNFISEIDKIGVKGFVLFNKLFEPEIDINSEKPIFPFNLSSKGDHRLPLRFAGLLHGNIKANICSSGGIFDGDDAIKMLLAGADAVQVVSTLYKNKIGQISKIVGRIEEWMDEKGYKTIDDFRGKLSRKNCKDPYVYLRAQYVDIILNSADELLKKHPVI
ncbi:MAG: dihydroorotate dehydrogenase-like protein [Bacteroidales bacterium]|nr:dihydroorotate dehydrogenase-like protein [Bacteroidales bacterium]